MAMQEDLRSMGTELYASAALENGHQISTVQSVLFGFSGRNTDASAVAYIFVFDTANGTTSNFPKLVLGVNNTTTITNGNFFMPSLPTYGLQFKNGIYIVASSGDVGAFSALSSNKLFFSVYYAYEDGVTNPS